MNSEEVNLSKGEVGKKDLALLWNPQILAFGHQVNLKKGHGKVWQALHKSVVCAHQSFMKIFQISFLLLHRALIERLASNVDTMPFCMVSEHQFGVPWSTS